MVSLIAFDIDGALTDKEGLDKFRELQNRSGVRVGIVTSRPKRSMEEFIQETNIRPAFAHSAIFKGIELRNIAQDTSNVERKIYYGSWVRDRFHSTVAGWEYKQI